MTHDVVSALQSRIDPSDLRGMFPGAAADSIRQMVAEFLRTLDISQFSDEQRKSICNSIKLFYDQFIRPIDLPYVPNVVEAMVDDWIWMSVESLIHRYIPHS